MIRTIRALAVVLALGPVAARPRRRQPCRRESSLLSATSPWQAPAPIRSTNSIPP